MAGPRRETRGIVDAPELFTHVHLRLRDPAPALRPHLEHYWLIDWDLSEPYTSHVVPHPSVHLVFQRTAPGGGAEPERSAEVYGIVQGLFSRMAGGQGAGLRREVPAGCLPAVRPGPARVGVDRAHGPRGRGAGRPGGSAPRLHRGAGGARSARRGRPGRRARRLPAAPPPPPDPQAERATELAELVRTDRSLLRVDALARAGGLSVRSLQRLFSTCVGVGPKWVILRHRIHEALQRAGTDPEPDWAALAADLGYSDQAHLARDFAATVGVPPTAFAQH